MEVSPALEAGLRRAGVYLSDRAAHRLGADDTLTFAQDCQVERYIGVFAGDHLCPMGAFSYTRSPLHHKLRIGRYCSIATDVTWIGAWHPLDAISTSTFVYDPGANLFRQAQRDAGVSFTPPPPQNRKGAHARLEHDVWIGQGAFIGRSLTIGVGAVVGARAVVTKDVEPYAVVAGNPARVVRRRFSDALCERLLASRWWDYAFTSFTGMPTDRPEAFLDAFDQAKAAATLTPIPPARPLADLIEDIQSAR